MGRVEQAPGVVTQAVTLAARGAMFAPLPVLLERLQALWTRPEAPCSPEDACEDEAARQRQSSDALTCESEASWGPPGGPHRDRGEES